MDSTRLDGKKMRILGAGALAAAALGFLLFRSGPAAAEGTPAPAKGSQAAFLDLTPEQIKTLTIDTVGTHLFPTEREASGSIDFNQDLAVQVFPPYQGTVLKTFVDLGSAVQKDQPLYAIKSPDLIQAEAALIAAEATCLLTTKALDRAKGLQATQGLADKDLEQAVSDQQAAEGALRAARDAVRIFGKTDGEMDQMVAARRSDPSLVVRSPIAGKITARNVQPGTFVQPGTAPAPFTVADVSAKWMVASVPETESPLYQEGQAVKVEVLAFPGKVFQGRIAKVGETVDPNTRRVMVRSAIGDPGDQLRPGMLATFLIRVKDPQMSLAVVPNAVVREADGTMTVWTTADRRRFTQRTVTTGQRRDALVEILSGLQPGERVVSDGTIFLSNMLKAMPAD